MRVLAAYIVALCLAAVPAMAWPTEDGGSAAANSPAPPANRADSSSPAATTTGNGTTKSELQQLSDLVEAQSKQLRALQEELQEQRQEMQEIRQQLGSTGTGVSIPAGDRPAAASTPPAIGAAVGTSTVGAAPASGTVAPPPANEPPSWAFKGVTFTPVGFFAAESVWRQRALSADVNTPFTSLPMPGSSPYNLSEFNASGRQSRIGMLVQGKRATVTMHGYYEADFLSAGTTSNSNQSNSYTLRQRQFWGQAAFNNGFTVTGGQMWSLVTQTSKGVDARTEVLPENIDAQYNVGFSWARQYGVRFAKNFSDKTWLAMSIEMPETTFKGGGTTAAFLFGEAGTGGGLYNTAANYSFNMTPDFVFKAAFEPGFGHYEVFGLISTFRDRIFPAGAAPFNAGTAGGGGGANMWLPFKNGKINFGLHALLGNGVGRYGSAGAAPDVTVQPDGTFAAIRSYQGLATLAFHYSKWDAYFHVGEEYAGRTQFTNGGTIPNAGFGAIGSNNAGCWTETTAGGGGYAPGALGNCANNARNIIEGTAGFWYSFYNGPQGIFKLGVQYSNVAYNTWPGVGPTGACTSLAHPSCGPSTNENMVFTSMRYYIP